MALEQFKTQVLLLHSQQSTLDALSAGFGDRYSVHLATTGTEALNTLCETPIHVIVSAQNLSGMTGLEALREAKKRSPETIGILLAGSDPDDGLEALVGDEEVAEIVRGAISTERLRDLIDAATKRLRLLTISKSANDLAANVDEPVEHVVLETPEHEAPSTGEGGGRLSAIKTAPHATPGAAGQNIEVLVLTKDEDFLEVILESSRDMHAVHHANTAAQASALVCQHKIGVLVTDAAMVGAHIDALTKRLRQDQPRLVAVVAGRRDDGELLMDLINRGQVYRFLLKPVSPGRARLAIEASVKYHLEAAESAFEAKASAGKTKFPKVSSIAGARAPGKPSQAQAEPETTPRAGQHESRPARPTNALAVPMPKILVGGALLTTLTVFGLWLVMPNEPASESPSVASERFTSSPSVVETEIPGGIGTPVSRQLSVQHAAFEKLWNEARAARGAGEIVDPAESNAIELYLAAREIAPQKPPVLAELERELGETVDSGLALAEAALLEQSTANAEQALELIRLADPENARLPFLDAQLAQLQQRAALEQARLAIREGRFEDAAVALENAAGLGEGASAEGQLLRQELAAARSEQAVDEVLTLARQRLEQNALTTPANDNARYYYELALSNAPENAVAQQGLTIIASKLVLRAREAIDAARLDEAASLLDDASALDSENPDLNTSLQALREAEAIRQREIEREALLQAKLEAERQRQEAFLRAKDAVTMALDADLQSPPGTFSFASSTPDNKSVNASFAGEPVGQKLDGTDVSRPLSPADRREYIAISNLKRLNYVAPDYPRAARRLGLTGWVDVNFVVDYDGNVMDVGVLDSKPGDMFTNSAIEAVAQWRFEPIEEDGIPVEKQVAVRLMFNLE